MTSQRDRLPRTKAVVAVAGHAGSGKTGLSAALARHYSDMRIVSFADAVRSKAESNGLSSADPLVLTDVGGEWVNQDASGLCREVIGSNLKRDGLLLVRGVKHDKIQRVLREMVSPAPILLVVLKSPKEAIVGRFLEDGRTQEEAAKVLADPTELDVEGPLLADADLVLDGTNGAWANVRRVADLIDRALLTVQPRPEFVGGLDRDHRVELVRAVGHEFGWLLVSEVASRLMVTDSEVESLTANGELLSVELGGTNLYPGFVLAGSKLNRAASATAEAFADTFSRWESVAWLLAGNGLLDGGRPIDWDVDSDIDDVISAELAAD